MPWILCTPAQAAAAVTVIDCAVDSYPRAGVDEGSGQHAPPAQTVTTGYAVVAHHPTDPSKAAVYVDNVLATLSMLPRWALLTPAQQSAALAFLAASTVDSLDSSWTVLAT